VFSSGQRPAIDTGAWSPYWSYSYNSPTYKLSLNSALTLGVVRSVYCRTASSEQERHLNRELSR